MNRFVESSDWVPKGDIILESAAENAVKSNQHLLVVAGPGAGSKLDDAKKHNVTIWNEQQFLDLIAENPTVEVQPGV